MEVDYLVKKFSILAKGYFWRISCMIFPFFLFHFATFVALQTFLLYILQLFSVVHSDHLDLRKVEWF